MLDKYVKRIAGNNEPPAKVLAKAGQTKDQSAVFHCSALVRAGQATLNFLFLIQQNIFNHQRLWADGSLFPSLRQYSDVMRNFHQVSDY